jgi:hypothetical protein
MYVYKYNWLHVLRGYTASDAILENEGGKEMDFKKERQR